VRRTATRTDRINHNRRTATMGEIMKLKGSIEVVQPTFSNKRIK